MCVGCVCVHCTPRPLHQKFTTRDEVEWRDCCSLHAVASSVINYSTHTVHGKILSICLFNKNQKVYWRIFGGMKKEKVCWRDQTGIWRHLCVSFNRSRLTPMQMHTEVTLLYKLKYYSNTALPALSLNVEMQLVHMFWNKNWAKNNKKAS